MINTYKSSHCVVHRFVLLNDVMVQTKSSSLYTIRTMVLISDGSSEPGMHVRSNLCYLICLRHLIKLRTITNRIFSEKTNFFHACATCSELPSDISATIRTGAQDGIKARVEDPGFCVGSVSVFFEFCVRIQFLGNRLYKSITTLQQLL